jgi:hypothetical protein
MQGGSANPPVNGTGSGEGSRVKEMDKKEQTFSEPGSGSESRPEIFS